MKNKRVVGKEELSKLHKPKPLPTLDRELELELKRELFSRSYYHFFVWSFNIMFPNERYEDAPHIRYICGLCQEEVERILRKEERTTDLLINIPPRTSKSLMVSVMLLAWMWIKDATLPMIAVSFDEDLSLLNAQYSKDLIKSDQYQELFGHLYQIRGDVDSKSFFQNDKGGFRLSKTTGSNITGHKGVVIVVDDPQNPKTSESEAHRKATIQYYTNALYNRLTPINLGIRIIIMQRLHENDLTGYLLKENPRDYRHICLPATLSNNVAPASLASIYKDGLLDPIRLNQNTLNGFAKTLGSRGYSGQYAQKPSPDEGTVFKKQWFDIMPPEAIIRNTVESPIHFFIDSAYTMKTENDPSGILTCFKQDGYLYILNYADWWLEFPELCKKIVIHVNSYQYAMNSKIFIEPKASGKSIVQQLRNTTVLNVIESPSPTDDKLTRATAIAPICEAKRVRLIDGSYVKGFLDTLTGFPVAEHDEPVDVLVMAVNALIISNGPDFLFL